MTIDMKENLYPRSTGVATYIFGEVEPRRPNVPISTTPGEKDINGKNNEV
jgi:hypothetical protein